MKKFKKLLFVLTVLAMLPIGVYAKEKVNVYLFKREGCMYCAGALSFFENLSKDTEYQNYFNLVVKDVSNTKNNNLMVKVAKKFNITLSGVPFTVIGERHFEGYAETFNDALKEAIKYAYENGSKDLITEENKDTSAVTIVILIAIIGGIVFLIYMGKDNNKAESEKEETLKENKVKTVEEKKVTPTKKAPSKKKVASTKSSSKSKTNKK